MKAKRNWKSKAKAKATILSFCATLYKWGKKRTSFHASKAPQHTQEMPKCDQEKLLWFLDDWKIKMKEETTSDMNILDDADDESICWCVFFATTNNDTCERQASMLLRNLGLDVCEI
mgnify:CR=1 FL=1